MDPITFVVENWMTILTVLVALGIGVVIGFIFKKGIKWLLVIGGIVAILMFLGYFSADMIPMDSIKSALKGLLPTVVHVVAGLGGMVIGAFI